MKDPIENKSQEVEMSQDVQDQLPGCAIVLIGFFLFVVGASILIFGALSERILLVLLGVLVGIFLAGFFLIYPFIKFLPCCVSCPLLFTNPAICALKIVLSLVWGVKGCWRSALRTCWNAINRPSIASSLTALRH